MNDLRLPREVRSLDINALPQTDEEALQYLPPFVPAENLYHLRRLQGDTIVAAMIVVLESFHQKELTAIKSGTVENP